MWTSGYPVVVVVVSLIRFFTGIFALTLDFVLYRFQKQSELNDSDPSDFHMALEEAVLADRGFTEKLIQDINIAAGNPAYDESVLRWVQEATGSNHDHDYLSDQASVYKCLQRTIYFIFNSDRRLPFNIC